MSAPTAYLWCDPRTGVVHTLAPEDVTVVLPVGFSVTLADVAARLAALETKVAGIQETNHLWDGS